MTIKELHIELLKGPNDRISSSRWIGLVSFYLIITIAIVHVIVSLSKHGHAPEEVYYVLSGFVGAGILGGTFQHFSIKEIRHNPHQKEPAVKVENKPIVETNHNEP